MELPIIEIEKDKYLNSWVVWLKLSNNAKLQIHNEKTKKGCKEWVQLNSKEILKTKLN